MIFKKSITNIFRSKGKSALFLVLIFSLTVVLSLGLSVWAAIDIFLDEANDSYMTVGLLEYMGPEYPDEDYYDQTMQDVINNFDYSIIENNENIISFNKSYRALGYVEGFERTDNLVPLKNSGVIAVSNLHSVHVRDKLAGETKDSLYSYSSVFNKHANIYPFYYDIADIAQYDHTYLMHGEYTSGTSAYLAFFITPLEHAAAKKAGITSSCENMVMDITTPDGGYALPEDGIFNLIAETYRVTNNSVHVYMVENIESLYIFHQQDAYITKGTFFSDEDYRLQNKVCIVSELFAKKMDVEVGDSIPLSVVTCPETSVYESYWAGTGFTYEDEYQIVGITNTNLEFNNNIYIPKRDDWDFSVNHIGYTIGQVIIKNDYADELYNDIEPHLPPRVRLTIYDQGYGALSKPFKDILRIAKIITAICILVSVSVIIFFSYLFVYRQRDVSDIMLKLGAGKKKVCIYFLFSTGFIALIASALGSLAAHNLSDYVIKFVNSIASNIQMMDTRFSSGNLTIVKEMIFDAQIDYSFFMYTALSVFAGAMICTLAFTITTFKKNKPKVKIKKVKKIRSAHTFKLKSAALKFSVLSIIRGGIRTLVVPLLSVAVVLFFCQLANTVTRYNEQLESITQNAVITAQYTDIKGRKVNNTSAEAYQVNDLINSGYIKDVNITNAVNFGYAGLTVVDGKQLPDPEYRIPSGFAYETFMDRIKSGPKLIYTNNISSAPEFFFSTGVVVTYLQGYDSSMFEKEIESVPCCVVSSSYMEERDIQLGNTIRLYFPEIIIDGEIKERDFMVAGSYEKQGIRDNIYCQLDEYIDLDLLFDYKEEDNTPLYSSVFDSVAFTICDASKLSEFKSYLDSYGFSSANDIGTYRSFMVIEDKKFISTIDMLTRQIRYINVLYPVLYTLVGIIALVVSYLLAVSRRKEFAIMRGLGARKRTTFVSFFVEQIILCIVGSALGTALSMLMYTNFTNLHFMLIAGYVTCYILGCVISIMIMNNTTVMEILKYED